MEHELERLLCGNQRHLNRGGHPAHGQLVLGALPCACGGGDIRQKRHMCVDVVEHSHDHLRRCVHPNRGLSTLPGALALVTPHRLSRRQHRLLSGTPLCTECRSAEKQHRCHAQRDTTATVMSGVYVHVPWCASRCPYCSFNVFVHPDPPYDRWVAGVKRDWAAVQDRLEGPLHSVYFGGGTPSLAPPEAIADLLEAIHPPSAAEITLEANPATITPDSLSAFRAAGINRVSVGVQTFNPRFARLLSRGHSVHAARELVGMVAAAGFRSWSVDIIFALPGQTLTDLQEDLDDILATAPPHVSLYGLTIKSNTPFERAQAQGKLLLPDEDTWRAQYDHIVATLKHAGLQRYEVSNFARPGHRAVHNEATWRGGHYAGLGPGAHGFLSDGVRTKMHDDLETWLADPCGQSERPDSWQAAVDFLLSTLRHIDGTDQALLRARTGHSVRTAAKTALVRAGLLHEQGEQLRLTMEGWPLADGITWQLCEALTAERGSHKRLTVTRP